jgi:hypothetical protein
MTDSDQIEWYEERVAIMTICGGVREDVAARHAASELRRALGSVCEGVRVRVSESFKKVFSK